MAIELTEKYLPYVDELFRNEGKTEILTNKDFDFLGAHSVRVWKISTSEMNDYGRNAPKSGNWSRYGAVADLDATTEVFTLSRDRSFTFTVDALDEDESGIQTASALARQIRERVIPEIDLYTITKIANGAGTKATAVALTGENIYEKIIDGTAVLDDAEVPEEGRILVVTADSFKAMKQSPDITISSTLTDEMRIRGVVGMVDGMQVLRVPASRVPEKFGFMICHPSATVGVQKLTSYVTHVNPVGISGSLVEGRICYDSFILDNKKNAIYLQKVT